ncbi:hypothetical protein J4E06_11185 [Muricauda sp. NFXS6]|uniref:hypothetical protein n=1 Tax=Allomuricauda sp. NFXS6 TaxID=2819094 RepID=UPI0032DF3C18
MTTEKRYEILDSLPTYGPMYVPISESGEPFYSEGVVVRFFRNDGTDWVANFQPGWTDLKEVIELEESNDLLIIANGTCYLMNPSSEKQVDVFGVGYSNVFKVNNGDLVLQDQTNLTIIKQNGTHWDSERISWDGLKEIQIEESIVKGLSYDPMYDADEWVEFSYDLNSKTLEGGSYHRYDNKKPWWKFW